MAQPVEIAFCRVWQHKSIQLLRAAELGAYMAMAHATLATGLDPLPADKPTRATIARIALTAWIRIEDKVMKALNDTLPVLRAAYDHSEIVLARRINRAKLSHESRRLKLRAKQFVDYEAQRFVDETALSGIIQPFQATKYNPNDYDKGQRQAAVSARETLRGKDRPLKD